MSNQDDHFSVWTYLKVFLLVTTPFVIFMALISVVTP